MRSIQSYQHIKKAFSNIRFNNLDTLRLSRRGSQEALRERDISDSKFFFRLISRSPNTSGPTLRLSDAEFNPSTMDPVVGESFAYAHGLLDKSKWRSFPMTGLSDLFRI